VTGFRVDIVERSRTVLPRTAGLSGDRLCGSAVDVRRRARGPGHVSARRAPSGRARRAACQTGPRRKWGEGHELKAKCVLDDHVYAEAWVACSAPNVPLPTAGVGKSEQALETENTLSSNALSHNQPDVERGDAERADVKRGDLNAVLNRDLTR